MVCSHHTKSICFYTLINGSITFISCPQRISRNEVISSTGKTQALLSLETPTSPIPTDQKIQREIVQGVLDDPMIPRSWVGAAWERVRNHFSSNKIDNSQSDHQMSQPPQIVLIPTTWVEISAQVVLILTTWVQYYLQIVPFPPQEYRFLIQTKIQTLNKFNLTWLWTMYNLWKIKLGKRVNV